MKSFMKEFKEFISKGNAMDLAVGMIIGAAFTAIVNSLVNDIISPLIGTLVKVDFSDLTAKVAGVDINYGAFIMAVLNFIIISFVIFSIIKAINKMKRNEVEEEAAPTTKVCPYCKSEIDIEATKCPHCTSQL